MTDPNLPELERLRAAYRAESSVPSTDVVDRLLARVERSHRMRRRRLVLASSVAGAVVAASGGVAAHLASGGSDEGLPSPSAGERAGTHHQDRETVETATVDALYRRLDAIPGVGYYIVDTQTDPGSVIVWTDADQVSRATAAVRDIAAEHQAVLTVRPRDELTTDGPLSEEELSRTASEIKAWYDARPEAGYAASKIEVPFGRIVVWRTDATEVDQRAQRAAAAAGAVLELRGARYRRADLQALVEALRRDNDRWRGMGFSVTGGVFTPSGAVVSVQGDTSAARAALRRDRRVLAVVDDTVIDTSAHLPGSGGQS